MSKRDYYETLGIPKSASADEIKKAFRKMAVKHHPDKEGGDEAKFKEVNEAYEVLKDSAKRQRYDQFGHAGVGGDAGGGSSGSGGFGGFQGFGGQGQNVNFDFGDNLGDIFGSFFGGGQQRRQPSRGQNVVVELTLTFEEAIFGATKDFAVTLNDTCTHCKGDGAEPGHGHKTCPTCSGSGQVNRVMNTMFGQIQQTTTCDTCDGRGKVPEQQCSVCRGKGIERRKQQIDLKVPAGIDDGAAIRLSGKGEAVAHGSKGDLYVNVKVKPHKKFTREGDLVLSQEHIDMVSAALGAELKVDTVDGELTIKVPAGTQSGTDFKLSGHGVPHLRGSARGAHIVTVHVDTPSKLTKQQKELLEQFKDGGKKRKIW